MFIDRAGYIVWFTNFKVIRGLQKHATVYYISRKMKYAVIYMNTDVAEKAIRSLSHIPYVKKVESSYRKEIKTEYEKKSFEKTRFYDL